MFICLVNKNNDLSLKFPYDKLVLPVFTLVWKCMLFFVMTFDVILKQTSHAVCLLHVESFRPDVIHM